METSEKHLGRRIAAFAISPEHLQRALFVAVLSLAFFMAMMVAYYIRHSAGYFLLATAFLILYLVMFISWVFLRRSVTSVYENGIEYKDKKIRWDEIERLDDDGTIHITKSKPVTLPATLQDRERLIGLIKSHLPKTIL